MAGRKQEEIQLVVPGPVFLPKTDNSVFKPPLPGSLTFVRNMCSEVSKFQELKRPWLGSASTIVYLKPARSKEEPSGRHGER